MVNRMEESQWIQVWLLLYSFPLEKKRPWIQRKKRKFCCYEVEKRARQSVAGRQVPTGSFEPKKKTTVTPPAGDDFQFSDRMKVDVTVDYGHWHEFPAVSFLTHNHMRFLHTRYRAKRRSKVPAKKSASLTVNNPCRKPRTVKKQHFSFIAE